MMTAAALTATRDTATALTRRRLPPATSLAGPAEAMIVEADPLLRLHAADAATGLGFTVVDAVADAERRSQPPPVTFVGLDCLEHCARCTSATAGRQAVARSSGDGTAAPFTVGYVAGPAAILAAHAAHRCTDGVVHLRAVAGRAAFVYPAPVGPGGAVRGGADHDGESLPPDLTPREADVLLLILSGFSTAEVAARLWLAPATARSHCRAILRKCDAADRRALRARLIGAGPLTGAASPCPIWIPGPLPATPWDEARRAR